MTKRKLLAIIHLPPPVHGPAMIGQFIKNSEVFNESFDVEFLSLQTSKSLDQVGKGGLSKILEIFRLYLRIFKTLLSKRFDYCYLTINAHGPAFYKEIVIVFLVKLFGIKPIYHYHMKGIVKEQDKWLADKLYRYQFNNGKVIMLSPYLHPDIAKYIPIEKIYFVPEGIPRFPADQLPPPKETENEVPEILFLSNLIRAKGVFVLLEACKILHEQGINFKTYYIGGIFDVPEKEFQQYVQSNNLSDKVSYLGPKYGPDKYAYFQQVDIFVQPTLEDCFPLTVLEAMQSGLPVVSTQEGAIPEMIVEGETGYVVPKNDPAALAEKIKTLVASAELRKKMGQAAKERYDQNYTMSHFEQNLSNTITKIMDDFEAGV